MSNSTKVEVFLAIDIPLEGLPEAYEKAINDHVASEPAIFLLPWPDGAIPPVGSRIFLEDMASPFDAGIVVRSHDYMQSIGKGLRVEVKLKRPDDSDYRAPPEMYLQYAARCGFVFFLTLASVKDVLESAGLPSMPPGD